MQVYSHHMQDFAQDGIFPNNDFCMCDYLVLRIRLKIYFKLWWFFYHILAFILYFLYFCLYSL